LEIADKRLESILLSHGLIDQDRLDQARLVIARHSLHPPSLQRTLLDLGFIQEEMLLKLRAAELGVPFMEIDEFSPDASVVTLLPEELCVEQGVVALEKEGQNFKLAMQDPNDLLVLERINALPEMKGLAVQVVMASRGAIMRKLAEYHDHYKIRVVERLLGAVQDQGVQLSRSMGLDIQNMSQVSEQTPIIKTVNLIILGALLKRASDIHILPERKNLRVLYRVDGVLQEAQVLPASASLAVVARIKVMSKLDISEKRLPQDGSFHLKIEGREIDFRVATTPTISGEKVVLRVLDKSSIFIGLDHLGFDAGILTQFKQLIHKPHGIILIVGPTGSGKTTTLYSALQILNRGDVNITTVEDPVEYELEGFSQIQVHADIGLTFANILRSILRQDPDIILVGEIRDLETTEIAVRAALTGHLVFATLHTNDASGAVTRLVEMGAQPYLIASALRGAMSQRLVRTICPRCREEVVPDPALVRHLGAEAVARHSRGELKLWRGKGCRHCFFTGYRGRTVVTELLPITDEIRRHILNQSPSTEVAKTAIAQGMIPMFQDGISKVLRGITTLEEVLEVAEDDL